MIGWVQAIAGAVVLVAFIAACYALAEVHMKHKHELRKKELEHKQKMVEDLDDE